MSTLAEIQDAIAKLPSDKRKALLTWLEFTNEPEISAEEQQKFFALWTKQPVTSMPAKVFQSTTFASESAHGLRNNLLR